MSQGNLIHPFDSTLLPHNVFPVSTSGELETANGKGMILPHHGVKPWAILMNLLETNKMAVRASFPFSLPASLSSSPNAMKMIISADVLLLLHRVCETDQRRLLEKACVLAPISYPCLLTCPGIPISPSVFSHEPGRTAWNIQLPHGKYYHFFVHYGMYWCRPGPDGKWKPNPNRYNDTGRHTTMLMNIHYFDGSRLMFMRRYYLRGSPSTNEETIIIPGEESGDYAHVARFISFGRKVDVLWY